MSPENRVGKKFTQKLTTIDIIRGFVCIAVGLVIAFPLMYAFSMSVMPEEEIVSYPPKILPTMFTLENFVAVFDTIPILTFVFNSLLIAMIIVVVQLLTSSLAAYAFVYYDFKFKKLIFIAILATMMIPGEATLISNYLTIASFQMLDTYLGLIIPFGASAMGIFLIRQNYLTIPKELKEASVIDGCSDIKYFVSILMPISMPTLAALGIYTFIGAWNQYQWPLLVTNSENLRTVQIGLSMLQFSDGLSYGLVMAGCVIILIPSLIVFGIGGKKMIAGVTVGSVKG